MHVIEKIHKNLIQQVGLTTNVSVLDYGCGRGGVVKLLLEQAVPPKSILAVDSDEAVIKRLDDLYPDQIKQGILNTQVIRDPSLLAGQKFDKIICHNVLECVENKEDFVRCLYVLLQANGVLVISHQDFDSAIYNSSYRDLTRKLIHYFSDKGEAWQSQCDGQIGRKIPGIFKRAGIDDASVETWRIVETTFTENDYGYLMAQMIIEAAQSDFEQNILDDWMKDLVSKANNNDFYFAIDLVIARVQNYQ